MDNFMSKLSQKINAQDAIKANFTADTTEKERMRKQLEEYDVVLQSMRNLFLKQEENQAAFQALAERLQNMDGSGAKQNELLEAVKESINKSDEFTHKECVKVYRNVQALLEEQNKKLEDNTQKLFKNMEEIKAWDVGQELICLGQEITQSAKTTRRILWFNVFLTFANIALILAIYFGVFAM